MESLPYISKIPCSLSERSGDPALAGLQGASIWAKQTEDDMAHQKLNCWEYMKCEREPGGGKVAELGICPSAIETSFNGINSGENAGRICWAVAGTCQEGEVYGTFAEKRTSCICCDFYKLVQTEEGSSKSANKFFSFFPDDEECRFLNMMSCKTVRAGKRLITQGEVRDTAYIIQRGSCLVVAEKEGELHPVGHRGRGDIVGVTSVLTGEPQNAHVEAETDMELWVLSKELFYDISQEEPELLEFLTEIVASRFDSRRPIADRAIGKYLATDIIGRGGYSIVYKGVHTGLAMPVAIKMMRHNMALSSFFQNNFRNEAKIIARLNHDNIIKVYDIEERYRTIFIIEQYVEGESLKELLVRLKTIPPSLAIDYLMQTCQGLDYAHKQGIIHRDINPSNILVQHDDRVKIVDFGVACPAGTEEFEFAGTISYMAPEQIEGAPVDQRADIYGLGITAYEMVTGKKPFENADIAAVMEMHLNRNVPDPGAIVPNLPQTLRRFITRAARRDPNERYQSAAEALKFLNQLSEEFGQKKKNRQSEKRKMANLLMIYRDEHQEALNQLMDEFNSKLQVLGVSIKSVDLTDL
jgi:tRNA A-37 threonylcarbamoyl transferase component Bud32